MPKKLLSLLLLAIFASACATTQTAQRGPVKPKAFVTPYEYYSHTRSALMTDQDNVGCKRPRCRQTAKTPRKIITPQLSSELWSEFQWWEARSRVSCSRGKRALFRPPFFAVPFDHPQALQPLEVFFHHLPLEAGFQRILQLAFLENDSHLGDFLKVERIFLQSFE